MNAELNIRVRVWHREHRDGGGLTIRVMVEGVPGVEYHHIREAGYEWTGFAIKPGRMDVQCVGGDGEGEEWKRGGA